MKTRWIQLIAGLAMVVLCISTCATTSNAALIWEDDFDDGNFDGWTIGEGNFTAASNSLECTEVSSTRGWAYIYRETGVDTGTWSFDCYLTSGQTDDDFCITVSPQADDELVGYSFIGIRPNLVNLWIRQGASVLKRGTWSSSSTFNDTWTHIDVTVDENMIFDVFVNDVHRLHYNASYLTGGYGYFAFNSRAAGNAIDNIVVNDTVDETLDFNITPTTTPTTPTTPPPIDPVVIAVVVGVTVAVIVLAIVLLRRR